MASDTVVAGLRAIGVRASTEALDAWLTHATTSRLSPVQVCEGLVTVERRERETRNLTQRTRLAHLGTVPPLDRFDWAHPTKIDRAGYEHLLGLAFLAGGQNVLLRGPSGVGKTSLAQNLGLAALRAGHTVLFATLAGALTDLLKQESVPALQRRLRLYTGAHLLVLDEAGYLPWDGRAGDLLYTIISRRHETRSTVVTTNLAFKQWNTIFPGAACVGALVDRFAQHCHTLDIEGESYRHRMARERAAKTGKPGPGP